MSTENTVTITWSPEDVQQLIPQLTYDQACEALERVAQVLKDRSIEEGWTILSDALFFNGYKANVIGAHAEVVFSDEGTGMGVKYYFSFGEQVQNDKGDVVADSFGVSDIDIFYYAEIDEWNEIKTGALMPDGWSVKPETIEYVEGSK